MTQENRGLTRTGTALMAIGALAAVGAIIVGVTNDAPAEPHASPSPSASASTPSASPSTSVDPASFVTAEGQSLMLDGEPFLYSSANAYTLMFEAPPTVAMYMKTAKDANFKVLRTWGFFDTGTENGEGAVESTSRNVYFQYWDPAAGAPAFNDGENGLERLDHVIAAAQEFDIKLVLPLVNNWTAFGGMDQYVRWADGQHHDDFFTDEQIKQWYKDWVSHVLNRKNSITGVVYKDDPTIMVWELGNELQCSDSGPYPPSENCGSEIMVEWATEMSQHVRSIDQNHLIGFGGEGFTCTEPGGDDWIRNCEKSADPVALLALDTIDLHGIHVYPNHWEPTEGPDGWQEWAAAWIDEHAQIASDANKPYYIGEYGWVNLSERMLVYDDWLTHFYDGGGDGAHFWLMQPAASIAAPPDSVGFTQRCPGPSCDLVSNWSSHVGDGVPWTEFGPIAENDFEFLEPDGSVTVDVLANDKVFAPATIDLDSIDLDPESAGVQSTVEVDGGTFAAVDGQVTFTASDGPVTTRVFYTFADSEGRFAEPRQLAVSPSS